MSSHRKPLANHSDTVVILSVANLSAAFDPDGRAVWCDWSDQPARTNDGFCQFCGSTTHSTMSR